MSTAADRVEVGVAALPGLYGSVYLALREIAVDLFPRLPDA